MELNLFKNNEKRCRGCLHETDSDMNSLTFHNVPICSNDQSHIEMTSLAEIYKQCIGIDADSSWDWLCQNCVQKLIDFYTFRRMCHNSFDHLSRNEICAKTEQFDQTKERSPNESYYDYEQEQKYSTKDTSDISVEKIDENSEQSETSNNSEVDNEMDTNKSIETETKFTCNICPARFVKEHRYEAHMRTHTGKKPWDCKQCDRAFAKFSTLKYHLAAYHYDGSEGKPEFICDVAGCGKSYTQKPSLRIHIEKIHCGKKPKQMPPKICEQCGKSFKDNAALIRHSYVHTKISPHKCQFDGCGKMFATKHKLIEHNMRHEGIKKHICPTCGLKKTTGHELRVHMRYHTDDTQYPCELCSLVFTRLANMKRHMKIVHCGIKPFVCPHCERTFAKAETLKHHVMTHTGVKPHACSFCDKRFIQAVALRTHLRTHERNK